MYLCKVGTRSSVLIKSLFQRCPLREVPLYTAEVPGI